MAVLQATTAATISVAAALMARHGLGILAEGVDRAGEVRRTAQQFAHPRPERVEHHLRRGTGRLRGIDGRGGGQGGVAQLRPISGQRTRHAAGELRGEIGELTAIAVEAALPGALGALAAVLAVHHGVVPPTINLDNIDPACAALGLNFTPNVAVTKRVDYALANSFGFGGTNASLVVGRV